MRGAIVEGRPQRRAQAAVWLLLPLLAAGGCARNFASFTFQDEAGRDGAAGSSSGRGARAGASGASDSDAEVEGGAGKAGSTQPEAGGGSESGSGAIEDASTDGSGHPGAGSEDADAGNDMVVMQCDVDWNQDLGVSPECRACSCDRCAAPVVDCATLGDPTSRRLCEDVFVCAMENTCQDFTCYCATAGCGSPGNVGDGPCAELMNIAANGTRSTVDALREADPPNYDEPLMRAVRAISCVLGVHPASPGGAAPGRCNDACPARN
jgi:hypothetical protein